MIFIDTGAFLAHMHDRDQHHAAAAEGWDRLEEGRKEVFTSNFVLDELFTLLARRTTYAFAAGKARSIYGSEVLTILRPDAEDEKNSLRLFEKFADQKVSFTDCVSFALMRRHKIQRTFTFDGHFAQAGFTLFPG